MSNEIDIECDDADGETIAAQTMVLRVSRFLHHGGGVRVYEIETRCKSPTLVQFVSTNSVIFFDDDKNRCKVTFPKETGVMMHCSCKRRVLVAFISGEETFDGDIFDARVI